MKKITKAVLAGMVMAGILGGCTSKDDQKDSQSSVASIQKEENIVLGDQNSENKKITLKNETGKNIVSFTLAPAELSSIPDNMLKNNAVWKDGKEADLYLDSQQAESESLLLTVKLADGSLSGHSTRQAAAENESADSQASSQSDEEEYSLYSFPVSRIGRDAVLTIEDGQLVLSWKDGNETLSTKTDQANTEESVPAEPEQPEEDVQEPEEPAQEEQPEQDPAASDQPVFQEPVYEEPVYFAPDGSELDGQDQQGSQQEGSSVAGSTEASFETVQE